MFGESSQTNRAPLYGNSFLIPLIGGSGGGGSKHGLDHGAAEEEEPFWSRLRRLSLTGSIMADGGGQRSYGGSGSGGAIRLVSRHCYRQRVGVGCWRKQRGRKLQEAPEALAAFT